MSGEERRGSSGGGGTGGNAVGSHSSHAHGGRRPVKVWNANRNVKKALVVATYEEFLRKGREKLSVSGGESLRIVLESDGTQVEDGEYFQTLPENTIFLVLRPGETWAPAGEDIVSQVVSTIPKIVCETLAALGLQDEIPSWKIMDNKGKITVVLHWEKEHPLGQTPSLQVGGSTTVSRGPSRQSSTCSTIAAGGPRLLGVHMRSASQRSASQRSSVTSTPCLSRDNSRASGTGAEAAALGARPELVARSVAAAAAAHQNNMANMANMLVQTSFDSGYGIHSHVGKDGKITNTIINDVFGAERVKKVMSAQATPLVTVINTDAEVTVATGPNKLVSGGQPAGYLGPPSSSRSIITGAPSPKQLSRQGSSIESSTVHQHTVDCVGGARLHQPAAHAHRGSPTSNECDFHCCSLHAGNSTHKTVATSPIQADEGKRTLPKGAHVRFDVENLGASNSKCEAIIEMRETENVADSSDSEGGEVEENSTCTKFLLLVDQLSVDQKHHLSIKDLGIILERLSSKILDVEKLDREKEDSDVYNWTIKATIRGDVMRELGVIYNSNYYSISEHPGYQPLKEVPGTPDDDQDAEDTH